MTSPFLLRENTSSLRAARCCRRFLYSRRPQTFPTGYCSVVRICNILHFYAWLLRMNVIMVTRCPHSPFHLVTLSRRPSRHQSNRPHSRHKALIKDQRLQRHRIILEIGNPKNHHKNPVAEKADKNWRQNYFA